MKLRNIKDWDAFEEDAEFVVFQKMRKSRRQKEHDEYESYGKSQRKQYDRRIKDAMRSFDQ